MRPPRDNAIACRRTSEVDVPAEPLIYGLANQGEERVRQVNVAGPGPLGSRSRHNYIEASVKGLWVSIPAWSIRSSGSGFRAQSAPEPLPDGVQSRSPGQSRDAQSSVTLLPNRRPGPIPRPDDGTTCRAG